MGKTGKFQQYDVYLARLGPAVGAEMKKSRPCVIISPGSMNDFFLTVVIAPLTSSKTGYPSRVPSFFNNRHGEVALDQMRSLDKKRLVKRLGKLSADQALEISDTLVEIFS